MDVAYSENNKRLIFPKDCNYDSYKRLQLVCPVCKEPVFLKNGEDRIAHFSHYKEGLVSDKDCSMRIHQTKFGVIIDSYSNPHYQSLKNYYDWKENCFDKFLFLSNKSENIILNEQQTSFYNETYKYICNERDSYRTFFPDDNDESLCYALKMFIYWLNKDSSFTEVPEIKQLASSFYAVLYVYAILINRRGSSIELSNMLFNQFVKGFIRNEKESKLVVINICILQTLKYRIERDDKIVNDVSYPIAELRVNLSENERIVYNITNGDFVTYFLQTHLSIKDVVQRIIKDKLNRKVNLNGSNVCFIDIENSEYKLDIIMEEEKKENKISEKLQEVVNIICQILSKDIIGNTKPLYVILNKVQSVYITFACAKRKTNLFYERDLISVNLLQKAFKYIKENNSFGNGLYPKIITTKDNVARIQINKIEEDESKLI